jgi:hypothetical protein
LANERFEAAGEKFSEEKFHTAAHLFINAAINYHNALCQKFLAKIPSHKQHSDTSYFRELAGFLGNDSAKYQSAYKFLISHKSEADYGIQLSISTAQQIQRKAETIKEIAEALL